VTITSGPNVVAAIDEAAVYSSMIGDKDSDLRAVVVGGQITFSGRVSGDDYGIYASIDSGGSHSYGVFVTPAKDMALADIASAVASKLTGENVPGVTVTASGAQVNVAHAELVRCAITSDIRVGQPVHNFGSSCSHCCNRRCGRILDARLELDVSLVQIDGGKKYVAEIKDIGLITGTHAIIGDEVLLGNYAVKKRGRTTGVTNGTVDYLFAEGNLPNTRGVFHRFFDDAIKISNGATGRFSAGGDSGSAVLNATNEVVGILFGGSTTFTYATPIQTIANALNVIVETATTTNPVTVPMPAGAHARAALPEAAVVPELDWDRLREAERELNATPEGNAIMASVRKHVPETQQLLRHNRRFAATWRRYGGPLIVQAVLRVAERRDEHLPPTIKGRPMLTCLHKIQAVLERCASSELCRDLARYQHRLETLLALTYEEVVASLRSPEPA